MKLRTQILLLPTLAGALMLVACSAFGVFSSKSARSLDVLACKAAVLAPYVGDMAAEVAREIDGNQTFSATQFLLNQGLTPAEILEAARAYAACVPPTSASSMPAPVPDGGVLL